MQGFLNLNKPFDWTSHDCVAKTRRLTRLKRVGHAGTLDPYATGVLPIALGRATRLLQYLNNEKAYIATIRLGIQTTTDDLEGEIIARKPVINITRESIQTALTKFEGKIEQIPPSYSAIQVGGKRLYDLARKGEAVEAPVRQVEVFKIEILDWQEGEYPELEVAIACGGGTYIRAIARDLGAALQTGGTLAALQRTQSSGLTIKDSITITDLEAQLEAGTFQPIPPDAPLNHLPMITIPGIDALKWCQGQNVNVNTNDSQILRVYDRDERFLGIGESKDTVLIQRMVFAAIS